MISAQGRERLALHSPLGFLRGCDDSLVEMQVDDIERGLQRGDVEVHGDAAASLWVRRLGWDSDFFGCPTYRIDFADWTGAGDTVAVLGARAARLVAALAQRHQHFYVFAEVPSEDTVLLQALGAAGLRLIETRLTYVHDALDRADPAALARARAAGPQDLDAVRAAAIEARNDFDRYHADPFYPRELADGYLAEYAAQCVKGFSDIVLVPGDDAPASAFVCGKADIAAPAGLRIGRLQLAGVAPSRRGWYRTLNEALLRWMHERGMSHVVNTTQSTNRAVIHVSTGLGYRYGRAAHILALGRGAPEGPGACA